MYYIKQYHVQKAYVFSYKNINIEGIVKKYPLYCLMFL